MQPSESSRSKLTRVAARSAASSCCGVEHGVGRDHDEHRGEPGREHPGALRHAADRPAVAPRRRRCFGMRVGRHDRLRPRRHRRRRESAAAAPATPREHLVAERAGPVPIRPVEQTSTSPAETSSASATASAVGWVVWNRRRPVKQFAPPELSTIADDDAVGDDLLRPDDRVRLRAVAGEDRGRRLAAGRG